MSAAPGPVDLNPPGLDQFPLRKAAYSMGLRSLPANCTHTLVRGTRVRWEGEARAGPQPQNRICLAPLQCSQHDHAAPANLSGSCLDQALPVAESADRAAAED